MFNIPGISLPQMPTKRHKMLAAAFLLLFIESYLRTSGHDLTWLSKWSALDIQYLFTLLLVLIVCWLGLPYLNAFVSFIWLLLCQKLESALRKRFPSEERGLANKSGFLTSSQLLSQAHVKKDMIAYQRFENHQQLVKKKRTMRELCFGVFIAVCANLCCTDSLVRHGFHWCIGRFPAGMIVMSLLIILLFVIGVNSAVYNDDEWTTVKASELENS